MYKFNRHFTLDEARAWLPRLRSLFASIRSKRQRLERHEQRLGKTLLKTGGDLGGTGVNEVLRDLVAINTSLAQLQSENIFVKDIERGLVDFPHLREGREVFLCWEGDEEDIEFWHDIEAGYAGRERL